MVVAQTALGPIGLATCYDLRFPELFRALVDAGAELVVLPAAWPAARVGHWSLLARARAVEDQLAVVRTARAVFPLADAAHDEPTADLLTQRMQVHEKTAWMLRANLG